MTNEKSLFSTAYRVEKIVDDALKQAVKPQKLRKKYVYENGNRTDNYDGSRYEFFIDSDLSELDGTLVDVIVPNEVYIFDHDALRQEVRPYIEIKDYEILEIDNFNNLKLEARSVSVRTSVGVGNDILETE